MEKTINKHWGILMAALMAVLSLGMASCSDNDGDGQPVITGVRTCDPETADSLFTKSAQGQTIAIIGKNLGGARKVFINDQEVYFSSTMNTDHSIIVKVPSESDGFQLTAFNSELKDEIRVETTHGTATYGFKVLGSAPSISRIQGSYPRAAGDPLNIYGINLFSIEKIYFTDVTAEALDTLDWEDVPGNRVNVNDYETIVSDRHLNSNQDYEVTSQLQITTPSLSFDTGTLVIECAAGIVYIPYSKVPGKPVIKSVSSDMPVLGEDLVIKGNEYVQVESVTFGDVTYTPDEFTVAESEDEIVIPITKVPSKGSSAVLTVTTPGGTATVERFFEYSCLLNDFDSGITDEGWGPNAEYGTYTIGGTGNVAHLNSVGQWWGQMIFFKKDWSGAPLDLPTYDVIPANVSADDLYFAFEVYDNNSDYNQGGDAFQGYLRYEFWFGNNINEGANPDVNYNNFEWDDYGAQTFINPDGPVLQDINGKAHTGKWYRHAIPLSTMPEFRGLTYQQVYENGIGIVRIMSYTQGTKSGNVDIYIDNIRLIYVKK